MNPPLQSTARPRSVLGQLAFPAGAVAGLATVLYFAAGTSAGDAIPTLLRQSPLITDLLAFVRFGLAHDPLLALAGAAFFACFALISSAARRRGMSTARLLSLFKSTGFSVALALVAAKLPRILVEDFTAAAGIAPVYQTLGWIIFAVAGACFLELVRETSYLLRCERSQEK